MKRFVSPVFCFFRARLGPRLVGAVIAGIAALWAFGALLEAVLDNATLVSLDVGLEAIAREQVSPRGLTFFDAVSRVASPTVIAWSGAVGAVMLWRSKNRRLFIAWAVAFAGFIPIELALKAAVQRSRPPRVAGQFSESSFSFPSGHSMAIVVGVGMLLYALFHYWSPTRWVRVAVVLLGVAAILLVGFSRVYLGAHYPSDVLGGYTAAASWLAVCVGMTTPPRGESDKI